MRQGALSWPGRTWTCLPIPQGVWDGPGTADCGARISHPHWHCRLKNDELLKLYNINDCSHLLIWQPATSWGFTVLRPVIKKEHFWLGRQLEEHPFHPRVAVR